MLRKSIDNSQLFDADCGGMNVYGLGYAMHECSQPIEHAQLFSRTPQFWDSGP